MADLTHEVDDLEALLASPGWARVQALFQEEWGRAGSRYLDTLEKVANAGAAHRQEAAEDMTRVIWVRKELEAFFQRIVARHQQLKHHKDPFIEVGPSRRGVL